MNRLIVIPISHFCEKARWALQRASVPFEEERHLQVFHLLPVRRASGGRLTPVFVTDSEAITESQRIVQYASAKLPPEHSLYPSTCEHEVSSFEKELDDDFGVETRKIFYEAARLSDAAFVRRVNNQGAPWVEQALFNAGYPLALRFLFAHLDITRDTLAVARRTVDATLDRITKILSDGRPYLFGDRFSAADLAFAALSAPLSLPPEYGLPLPPSSEFPPAVKEVASRYEEHPAIVFARRIYREERHRVFPETLAVAS